MKLISLFFIGLVLLLAGCSKDNSVDPVTEQQISGNVTGVAVMIFDNQGNPYAFQVRGAVVSGSFKGTSDADLPIRSIDSNGTIHFEGMHIFYDEGGNIIFRTSDKGTATATGEVENHLTIIEGKSGQFITKGNVNLQTGELALTYEGKVQL